jgi:KaiC/GvpD/RAD55 family RecA-like ATPase
MMQCNQENKTLIMTEGQIDSMSVAEAGYENAVSVPMGKNGFTWVPHCWDWLQGFDKLIMFGDFERGSMTLLQDMKARFHGSVWQVRPEDYRDCKDANEILMKYGVDGIRQCIENAEHEMDEHIIRMADVTPIDLAHMEHYSSGFTQLDKLIGGFYFGQVILITGKRGKGKSTLASQFLCKALRNEYTCFAYSGEMTHPSFREWMDRQLAGPENLVQVKSDSGKVDWTVKDWKRNRLHDWYYHTMWLHDERGVSGEETSTLMGTVEKAVKEYGIRVVLLDNLMTALEDDKNADLNRTQSNFVRGLARIARAYNVIIFLVAHPRKRKGDVTDFDADDVMGSGNITNAVDVVLQYDEAPDRFGKPDRLLAVKKNRLTGDVSDGIDLWFDPASKRITERKDDFSWETDRQTYIDVTRDEEVPF